MATENDMDIEMEEEQHDDGDGQGGEPVRYVIRRGKIRIQSGRSTSQRSRSSRRLQGGNPNSMANLSNLGNSRGAIVAGHAWAN